MSRRQSHLLCRLLLLLFHLYCSSLSRCPSAFVGRVVRSLTLRTSLAEASWIAAARTFLYSFVSHSSPSSSSSVSVPRKIVVIDVLKVVVASSM